MPANPQTEVHRNHMTYVIVEPCIGTKNASCVDVCPVSCIYEAEDMYYINPDECIECGACEPECPVNAIFHESAVPDEWKSFTQKNSELSGLSLTPIADPKTRALPQFCTPVRYS